VLLAGFAAIGLLEAVFRPDLPWRAASLVVGVGSFDDLPSSVSAAIFRLAQESITNARRHARHATRIDVEVTADDTAVRLRVADDGRGGEARRSASTAGLRPEGAPGRKYDPAIGLLVGADPTFVLISRSRGHRYVCVMSDRKTTPPSGKRDWIIPALLLGLSVVPVAAGAFRLGELSTGAEVTPDNARFFAAPVPVILHILSVSLYAVLGAFQFSSGFRRRRPRWHRRAGWVLVPSGIVAAATGLWMQAFYELPAHAGDAIAVLRLLFGSAMVASLVLGVVALFRRDFVRHGAWMLRGYAIGMGAGTQVLTHVPWVLLVGQPDEGERALLMGAGWVINVAVAEWIVFRRRTIPPAPTRVLAPSSPTDRGDALSFRDGRPPLRATP
jgi:hypothetical protein